MDAKASVAGPTHEVGPDLSEKIESGARGPDGEDVRLLLLGRGDGCALLELPAPVIDGLSGPAALEPCRRVPPVPPVVLRRYD